MKKIAVIGAGLAGVTLAQNLKDKATVTLFEKARGVGGRMATRRAGPFAFDHGAQYFTVRADAFTKLIAPLVQKGLIKRWTADHVTIDGGQIVERHNWAMGEARYVATPGMNILVKHLATDLDIQLATQIVAILPTDRQPHQWILIDGQGTRWGPFDWVAVTAPAPQTDKLLPSDFAHGPIVSATKMQPCYSLMVGLSEPLALPYQAAHIHNDIISWLAVNASKPDRPAFPTLVAHASHAFTRAHIDEHPNRVTHKMMAAIARITGLVLSPHAADAKPLIRDTILHRWMYANNETRQALPVLVDSDRQLAACGDWCCGGRVEGAFMSALRTAQTISTALRP